MFSLLGRLFGRGAANEEQEYPKDAIEELEIEEQEKSEMSEAEVSDEKSVEDEEKASIDSQMEGVEEEKEEIEESLVEITEEVSVTEIIEPKEAEEEAVPTPAKRAISESQDVQETPIRPLKQRKREKVVKQSTKEEKRGVSELPTPKPTPSKR